MSISSEIQLQALLDSGTDKHIELSTGEYAGPIVIRRSMIIDGKGATLWALNGPVLVIERNAVVELKNLKVEVTGDSSNVSSHQEVAIKVESSAHLDLDEVEVRGDIQGVPCEAGLWRYPKSLFLGCIPPMQESEYKIRLITACACKLVSGISGVECIPASVPGGPVEITIRVEKLRRDTLLFGRILLKTAFSKRWFVLNGHVADSSISPISKTILWQPSDWDTVSRPSMTTPSMPPQPTLDVSQHSTTAKPVSAIVIHVEPDTADSSPVVPVTPDNLPSSTTTNQTNAGFRKSDPTQLGIFGKPNPADTNDASVPQSKSTPLGLNKAFPKLKISGSTPTVGPGSTAPLQDGNGNTTLDEAQEPEKTAEPPTTDPASHNPAATPPKRMQPASNLFRKNNS